MSKIVVVAGYTKKNYLTKIRLQFKNSDTTLACAYTRKPNTESKEAYLKLFDTLYDLSDPVGRTKLKQDAPHVLLVTCTQERDMVAYIEAQLLCGKITAEQSHNYTTLIDKEFFKKSLQKIHPELVPTLHSVTPELLNELDTLNYPLVIKPTGLTGSTLVKIVSNSTEFKAHYENFKDKMIILGKDIYDKEINIIAETYISGPQYSMNVYINNVGEVVFCPLIRVITPTELGIDDTYSALQYTTDELSDSEMNHLRMSIKKVISHFKVRDTSMHFDCVLNGEQWMFFEAGLRIGGNRQKLFELSNGMDHFLNDILNRMNTGVIMPKHEKTACIVQKAATVHGTLKKISYQRIITEQEAVMVSEDKISEISKVTGPVSTGGGTLTRHFVSGKDSGQVIRVSKELFNNISYELS